MNAYVWYYGPEPKPLAGQADETTDERHTRLNESSIVQFGADPRWKIATKEEADIELRIIRRMDVNVGGYISCKFEIEELPVGGFAIVCINHPGPKPE